MGNGSGVSRGDRNRNARLGRLRELVPLESAIVGIDEKVPPGVAEQGPKDGLMGAGFVEIRLTRMLSD